MVSDVGRRTRLIDSRRVALGAGDLRCPLRDPAAPPPARWASECAKKSSGDVCSHESSISGIIRTSVNKPFGRQTCILSQNAAGRRGWRRADEAARGAEDCAAGGGADGAGRKGAAIAEASFRRAEPEGVPSLGLRDALPSDPPGPFSLFLLTAPTAQHLIRSPPCSA